MKELFLHIGMPKTGTSAIQRFCDINADKLYENGLIYRKMPFGFNGIQRRLNAYFLCATEYDENGNKDEEALNKKKEIAFNTIKEWFEEKDKVLLTTEGLWNYMWSVTYQPLRDIKTFADENGYVLKIVVYLRRQDTWAESLYRQRIKNGRFYGEMEEFFNGKKMALDYDKHLTRIARVAGGEENVIVRRYEKEEFYNGKIELDFLKALGVETECDYTFSEMVVNPSLPMNYIEIKRILSVFENTGEAADKTAHSDSSVIWERSLRLIAPYIPPEYNWQLMSNADRKALMDKYEKGNNKVADKYLNDGRPLFETKEGDEDEKVWTPYNEDCYRDAIIFFGGVAMYQNDQINELTAKVEALTKQVEKLTKTQSSVKEDVKDLKNGFGYRLFCFARKIKRFFTGSKQNENDNGGEQ